MITEAVQLNKVLISKWIKKIRKTCQSQQLAEGIKSKLRQKAKEVGQKVDQGDIIRLIQIIQMEVGYLVLDDLVFQVQLEDKYNVKTLNRQTNQMSLIGTQIANGWIKRTQEGPLHP